MHLRTLSILILLVGALAAAVWWQSRREERELFAEPAALFEGVQAARIVRLRVDNLERSVQLAIELDPEDGWTIVDPIEAPAEGALIGLLLEALSTQQAFPVADADPGKLALSPPRAVLEFEEQVGGERVRRRLELGATDLDGQHAFVRADGEIVRTLRTFESILDRSTDEWRTRSIVRGLRAMGIVEAHRRGEVAFEEGDAPLELELDIVNDGGWHATSPWRAGLDPGPVGLLLQTASSLRASAFIDDAPVTLEPYGLDDPDIVLELVDGTGRREVLQFAPMNGEDWYALASSDPRIYSVSRETMLTLTVPPDLLVERDFARLVRERVERVTLTVDGRELALDQRGGDWTMTVREADATSGPVPADPQRVGDLLSELERARVLALLPDEPFAPAPDGPLAILIEHDGRTLGGSLGASHALADGGRGVLFRRAGDTLVTLVDEGLVALARSEPREFENRQLVRALELDLARIDLARGAAELAYARNDRGRWARLGTEVEARSFAILVDRLLSVRLAEDGDPGELVDPLTVTLVKKGGAKVEYELGAHSGELDAFRSGPRRALIRGGLHDALASLFEAP